MKPPLTEREQRAADEQLRRLPRLKLETDRRERILQQALILVNPAMPTHPITDSHTRTRRRTWGGVAAATTAVAVGGVLGVAAIYTHGKFGTGLANPASSRGTTANAAAYNPNHWMTDTQKRNLVAQAVANLFQGQPPKSTQVTFQPQSIPIVRMQAAQGPTGQRIYRVKMEGVFHDVTDTQHDKETAKYLSFTIAADGSKVGDVQATTGSSKTLWTVKVALHPQIKQLVYSGGSKDWTGAYRQGSVQIWWKNQVAQMTQLGSSRTSQGMVWYTGSGPVPDVTAYSVGGTSARSSGTGPSILQPKPEFSLPSLDMQNASDNIHVAITANGHKQTFLLRDIANQGAVSVPR